MPITPITEQAGDEPKSERASELGHGSRAEVTVAHKRLIHVSTVQVLSVG